MKPIDFPQSTKVLQKPEDMFDADCKPLPVWSDGKQCVSCWRPTFKRTCPHLVHGQGVVGRKCRIFATARLPDRENPFVMPPFFARVRLWLEDGWDNIKEAAKAVRSAAKERDKRIHFVCGFLISLVVGFFLPILGLFAGSVAGAIKEWWDSKGHGAVELMDFVFTCFGAVAALIPSFILHSIVW